MIPESRTRILIIDDEPGLLFSLAAFLEDEGYAVEGVSSGEDALHFLKTSKFDAVIIDIRLPGKDGNEVMLEALKDGCQARFLIHTGSSDYQIPQALAAQGITKDDIFLKPLADLEILSQALGSCLRQYKNCNAA